MDVQVRIRGTKSGFTRIEQERIGCRRGTGTHQHIGIVVVIARIEIFEAERDVVGEVELAAGADLATQLPIVIIRHGEGIGSVGGDEIVIDIGIGDAARDVEQATAAAGRDAEAATHSDRFVQSAYEGVARRGGAETGRIIFRFRQRALDQQAGNYRTIADALVEADADAVAVARLVVAAAVTGFRAIGGAVAITGAESIGAGRRDDPVAIFTVAIGVEGDAFTAFVVDCVEPEVPADVEAVEEAGFCILCESRLSEGARENRGGQKCRFFH